MKCRTLKAEAVGRPELLDYYPGLRGDPQTFADVRRYRDLNSITHEEFQKMAAELGFELKAFKVHATRVGRWLRKAVPALRHTSVLEVFSTGAGAVLVKSRRS